MVAESVILSGSANREEKDLCATAAAQPPKRGIARDADGKLIWRLDSKPCAKRKTPLRFRIEHPADLPVPRVE